VSHQSPPNARDEIEQDLHSDMILATDDARTPAAPAAWGWRLACLAVVMTNAIGVAIAFAVAAIVAAIGVVLSPYAVQVLSSQIAASASVIVVFGFMMLVPSASVATIGFRPVRSRVLALIPAIVACCVLLGSALAGILDFAVGKTVFSFYQPNLLGITSTGWSWLLLIVPGAGEGPILEEALYRGILYTGFRHSLARRFSEKQCVVGATICSSVIFTVMHFNISAAPSIFVLGIFLCLTYESTSSIVPGIGIHCIYNLIMFAGATTHA
jgi:membrane protease YdiL (CAAX protease family)